MNNINVKVNFEKGVCYTKGINLITGDYNSTKLLFDFDITDGKKIFEMKSPSNKIVIIKEITDNEIVLVGIDGEQKQYSLFQEVGAYKFEVSLYKDDSKLTSSYGTLYASEEQIKNDEEVAEPYIPVFDNLIAESEKATRYATEQGDYAKGIGDDLQEKLDSGYFKGEKGDRGEKGEKGDTGEVDTSQFYNKKEIDDKIVFNKLSNDSNIWEIEAPNVTDKDIHIYLQEGSSVPLSKGTIITTHTENDKIGYYILSPDGKVYYGKVGNDGTAEENGNALIDLSKVLTNDNTIEYQVDSDFVPTHKKYVDEQIKDNYYNLEKNINEENNNQTIMNIRAKDDSYSLVMCVDNLDIPMEIPSVDVLGAEKGKDFEKRIKALETSMTNVNERLDKLTEVE